MSGMPKYIKGHSGRFDFNEAVELGPENEECL